MAYDDDNSDYQYDQQQPQQPPPDNGQQDKRNSLNQWSQQYLGRGANDQEMNGWLGASNFGTVEDSIKNSAEAKSYANKQAQPNVTPFDHDTFRNAWMGTGTNVAAQNQLLKQYGLTASGNGTVTLPDGAIMDLRQGARSGLNQAQWMGVGEVHNGVTSMYGSSGGGGQATDYAGGGAGAAGSSGNQAHDPKWDALYQQLMDRSKQSLNLDGNDPIIKGQTDAYNANLERSRRNFLADQAESGSPYATGAQLGQSRMTAEAAGQQGSQFQSQLMGRELESRRSEIQNALEGMGGMLSQQQQLALQKELGYLNDATQRYGIQSGADTARYGIDSNANTARDRLGLDYGNSQANYWLRSQGL